MSLKVVPFKSLGCGFLILFAFCSNYMAVSVAVCYIFSVKEWPDLETRLVRVHSRSLEMAPIDRSHTSLNT